LSSADDYAYLKGTVGKPAERQGRKASGLRTSKGFRRNTKLFYDSGAADKNTLLRADFVDRTLLGTLFALFSFSFVNLYRYLDIEAVFRLTL